MIQEMSHMLSSNTENAHYIISNVAGSFTWHIHTFTTFIHISLVIWNYKSITRHNLGMMMPVVSEKMSAKK